MIRLLGRLLAPEDEGLRLVTVEGGRVTRIGEPADAPPDVLGVGTHGSSRGSSTSS